MKSEPTNWKLEYQNLLLEYILFRIEHDDEWYKIFKPVLTRIMNEIGEPESDRIS